MNTVVEALRKLENGEYDVVFEAVYGSSAVAAQKKRYIEAVQAFAELFGSHRPITFFSAPGRTEIGGNHTDHNHGRVLAGSVNLDVIAVASPSDSAVIRIQSKGYPMDTVELGHLSVNPAQVNHSSSLIRGVADRFVQTGAAVGGLDAYTTSDVLKGSGLSSSAAFEVLVGTMLNHLYNDGQISPVDIAKIAQYAENVHFGKPSGLMDQMASSVGGIITIDFADTEKPVIQEVNCDFNAMGYRLCIVDTGGNHADLTPEYASVPAEMKAVAASLGCEYLRQTNEQTVLENIIKLRETHGDRAVLRALHFLRDNERVVAQVKALEAQDFDRFHKLIIESGHSSFEYLQNVYATSNPTEQGLSLALCLAQALLDGKGSWRVHGGGFAGTTQNFVPVSLLQDFCTAMEKVFGQGNCHVLNIRKYGGICLDTLKETL